MRKKILAANWKMNKSRLELEPFFDDFSQSIEDANLDLKHKEIIFGLPFTFLVGVEELGGWKTHWHAASQNVHWETKGAFTGETSVDMLKEVNVEAAIVGHSERRQYFHETDEDIAKKVAALQKSMMTSVLCIGESLEQRNSNQTNEVLSKQLKSGLALVDQLDQIVVAYEPVWAIGTGLAATPEQAGKTHSFIRKLLAELFDQPQADATSILYGGSAKPANIKELMAQEDIDGALVGGASLDAKSFFDMLSAI